MKNYINDTHSTTVEDSLEGPSATVTAENNILLIGFEDVNLELLKFYRDTLKGSLSDLPGNVREAVEGAIGIFQMILQQPKGLPIYVRKQYHMGIERYYPSDSSGLAMNLLSLSGKNIFTKEILRAIKSLGFSVELAPEQLNLEDTPEELKRKESFRVAMRQHHSSKKHKPSVTDSKA